MAKKNKILKPLVLLVFYVLTITISTIGYKLHKKKSKPVLKK